MAVGRHAPRSPWPFDARSPSTGDFWSPYPEGARAFLPDLLRLLWSSRLRYRSRVGCSGLWSLRQPPMPSADFCTSQPHLAVRSCPKARVQISRGKTRDLPPKPDAYTHDHSRMTSDLGLNAPSSTAMRLVYASCSSVRGFACSFLQIPARAGHPCCSARSSCHQGLQGTFTPKSLPISVSFHGCQTTCTVHAASRHARRTSGGRRGC